eukprot:Nk52_evm1s698 gene=Nk52_evmTU1s698
MGGDDTFATFNNGSGAAGGGGGGGSTGNEAAHYVKLISSDGHEFIVNRNCAMVSGTIKSMLSGPGNFSENESNEINFREI